MNKFDYEAILTNIKLLEMKAQRIVMEQNYLEDIKPSLLEIKKRKEWEVRKSKLLIEKKSNSNLLVLAYAELENLF